MCVYMYICVTGVEIRIGIYIVVHAWLVKGKRLGTLAGVQASGMPLLFMCKGFSHLNEDVDDCDII